MLKGKIIKNISNDYEVATISGNYVCKARGKFRNLSLSPLVGDEVEIDEKNNYIINILERKNELKRPAVANIDLVLIVCSLKKPNLVLNLLDKQITSIILAKIEPVICFTKLDLANKEELTNLEKISQYYESIGIKVFTNNDLSNLIKYLKNKYVVLTGQTGAGKSSLINKIDGNLNLKVQEISEALGRGKHTTRHTQFYHLKDFYLCDTPGFSALSLQDYSLEEIKSSFKEFQRYACPFKDCSHIKEKECAVKQAVEEAKILKSRYLNYVAFSNEVKKF